MKVIQWAISISVSFFKRFFRLWESIFTNNCGSIKKKSKQTARHHINKSKSRKKSKQWIFFCYWFRAVNIKLAIPVSFWAHSKTAFTADKLNRTELTCTKLTQLHDALLVTRVSVTKLIGCRQGSFRAGTHRNAVPVLFLITGMPFRSFSAYSCKI